MKTAKRIIAVLLTALMVISLAACGGSSSTTATTSTASTASSSSTATTAASTEVVKLKFGCEGSTAQTSVGSVVRMADTLKELSGGTMELEVFTDGALGGEDQLVEACSLGTVDMIICAAAAMSGVIPQYLLIDLPFSYANKEEALEFLDGDIGTYLFGLTEDALGYHGLAYLENGFRCFTTNGTAIHQASDLQGLKMRCMNSQVYMDMYKALGASPTVITYGEVYSACQQGTIDGEENPLGNIYAMKFYEVQEYITLDNHVYDPDILFINNESYAKLTDEQKGWLQEAADKAKDESRACVGCMTQDEYIKFFEDNGCEVIELSDAEHQTFVDATADVYTHFTDKLGDEAVALYREFTGR